jgi:hypothetical protein
MSDVMQDLVWLAHTSHCQLIEQTRTAAFEKICQSKIIK